MSNVKTVGTSANLIAKSLTILGDDTNNVINLIKGFNRYFLPKGRGISVKSTKKLNKVIISFTKNNVSSYLSASIEEDIFDREDINYITVDIERKTIKKHYLTSGNPGTPNGLSETTEIITNTDLKRIISERNNVGLLVAEGICNKVIKKFLMLYNGN